MPGVLGGVAAAIAALKASNQPMIGYAHGSTAVRMTPLRAQLELIIHLPATNRLIR